MRALKVTLVLLAVEFLAYGSCGFVMGHDLMAEYDLDEPNHAQEEARANSWIIHPPPRPLVPLGWYNLVKNGTTMSPLMMMMFMHTSTPMPPSFVEESMLSINGNGPASLSPEAILPASGTSFESLTGPSTLGELDSGNASAESAEGPAEEAVVSSEQSNIAHEEEEEEEEEEEVKEESVLPASGVSEIEVVSTYKPLDSVVSVEPEIPANPPGSEAPDSSTTITNIEDGSDGQGENEEPAISSTTAALSSGSDVLELTPVSALENVDVTQQIESVSQPLSEVSSTASTELDGSSSNPEPNDSNLDVPSDNGAALLENEPNEQEGDVLVSTPQTGVAEPLDSTTTSSSQAEQEGEDDQAALLLQGQEQLVTLAEQEPLLETGFSTTAALGLTGQDDSWLTTPQTDDTDTTAFTPESTSSASFRQFQKRALLAANPELKITEEGDNRNQNGAVNNETSDDAMPEARQQYHHRQRPYPIAPNYMQRPVYNTGYYGQYPDPMATVARVYDVCYTAWCSVKKSLRRYGLL